MIDGPSETKELDWGTITVPKQVAVGQDMPVVVTFKEGAVKQNAVLRIDLHWWKGENRAGVMGGAQHPALHKGDTGPVVKKLRVKDKPGLSAVAAVVYASPDGSYGNRFISGSAGGIEVVAADQVQDEEADDAKTKTEAQDEPAAQENGNVETKQLDWGTLTITKEPAVGQDAVVTVTLAEGVVTEPTVLSVDMHWWKGRKRAGVVGRFGRRNVKPGQTGPFTFRKTVPDKDGIAAIAGVVGVSPDGSWKNKTHASEIGTRVGQ